MTQDIHHIVAVFAPHLSDEMRAEIDVLVTDGEHEEVRGRLLGYIDARYDFGTKLPAEQAEELYAVLGFSSEEASRIRQRFQTSSG